MFDPKDPFDAAALFDMWFNCNDCDRLLNCEPDMPIGLDYYHELGQAARQQGWYVAESPASRHEEPQYQVLCPHCAARQGLKMAPLANRTSQAIEALCRSLRDAA